MSIAISTAIAVSAPGTTSVCAERTRLRMTDRGRRVLAALVALPLVIAIAIAVLSGGSAVASLDSDAPAAAFTTVTVFEGDTLWGIAQDVAPTVDPRDVIADIVTLNSLTTTAVVPGQSIAIPAKYDK